MDLFRSNPTSTADVIVDAVEMATHAFSGVDLSDDDLDRLCEAVLSHNDECAKKAEVRKGLTVVDAINRPSSSPASVRRL